MKQFFFISAIIMSTLSFAQPPQRDDGMRPKMNKMAELSAENRATLLSKKMTLKLDLSKEQQAKVYQLFLEKSQKRKDFKPHKQETKLTKEMRFETLNKRLDQQIAFKAEMKSILTKEQYARWSKMSARKRKPHKRKKQRV